MMIWNLFGGGKKAAADSPLDVELRTCRILICKEWMASPYRVNDKLPIDMRIKSFARVVGPKVEAQFPLVMKDLKEASETMERLVGRTIKLIGTPQEPNFR